jgi:molybdate transport system ATP-binding protein
MELRFYQQRQSFILDIDATLPDDGAVGVYGPSGAGKSTLLSMMTGSIRPETGRFSIGGECLFDSAQGINIPIHQRRIGMVFQDSRLFPHLTVQDNLNYGFKLLAPKDRRFSLPQILDLLEIGHLLTQKPHQLSGGEKQRVALGRALLASPRLLLLDEPLASLDVRLKRQILPFLRRIKDETHTPMIYVSHAIDEILYLTPQVAMLDKGKILAVGAFNQVIHDDRVLALAHSLGLENVLNVKITAHYPSQGYTAAMACTQLISMPPVDAAIGSEVSVSVAASNVALSLHRAEGISIQNQLAGTVTSIRQIGSRVLVSVDTGAELIAEITAKALIDMKITQGSKVFCLFKTQGIYAFSST